MSMPSSAALSQQPRTHADRPSAAVQRWLDLGWPRDVIVERDDGSALPCPWHTRGWPPLNASTPPTRFADALAWLRDFVQ